MGKELQRYQRQTEKGCSLQREGGGGGSTVQERVMQMQMGWLSIIDKKKIDRNSRLWRGGGPVWCRLVSAFLFFFVLSTPIYYSFLHHLCLCPLKQKKVNSSLGSRENFFMPARGPCG